MILQTNEECWHRVVGEGDSCARSFFTKLRNFAIERSLLEPDFDAKLPRQFHELFWEIYLAAALASRKIEVKRGNGKASEPDFWFLAGNRRIYLEAVACGEASEKNWVTPPVTESPEFESGLAPTNKILQRLSQSIDGKLRAIDRKKTRQSMNRHGEHAIVIAINGNRAINGHPHDDIDRFVPFIVRSLFGTADQRITQDGRIFWRLSRRMPTGSSSFPFGHFADKFWHPDKITRINTEKIAGAIYSKACVFRTDSNLGADFLYVQNPFGPDLTAVFDWCPKGVWELKDDKFSVRRPSIA